MVHQWHTPVLKLTTSDIKYWEIIVDHAVDGSFDGVVLVNKVRNYFLLVLDSESFSIDNSTRLSLQVCDIVGEAWIWQSDWLTCVRAEALPGRRSDSESRVRGSRASPWCPLVTVHANLSHRPLSLFNSTRNLSWEETLGSWLLKW